MVQVFEKTYDGESIVDMQRDVYEAFDERYNSALKDVSVDEYGIQKGTFTVTIQWSGDEE